MFSRGHFAAGRGNEEGEGRWKREEGVQRVIGRGGDVNWNRAADWLRPALASKFTVVLHLQSTALPLFKAIQAYADVIGCY